MSTTVDLWSKELAWIEYGRSPTEAAERSPSSVTQKRQSRQPIGMMRSRR